MLPIKRINTDTRHRTDDSKSTAFFEIDLIGDKNKQSNTAFYITDITVPMRWYAVEAGNNDVIYFRINGTGYAIAQCTIPEGNYATITFGAALCKLRMTIIHSLVLLVERNQQILFQLQIWPITLSLYQIRLTPLKYLLMSRLLRSCLR